MQDTYAFIVIRYIIFCFILHSIFAPVVDVYIKLAGMAYASNSRMCINLYHCHFKNCELNIFS
jgi:hypothetical protein